MCDFTRKLGLIRLIKLLVMLGEISGMYKIQVKLGELNRRLVVLT